MFDSKWTIQRKERQFRDISEEVLDLRGIENKDSFLNSELSDLNNPFLMNDMEAAVDRILDAVDNSEKICIYGDYDADGLTSAAILGRFMASIEADFDIFIPDRFDDGYGLSIECLKGIIHNGTKLVITTDCGINSINEALFLKKNDVDLIITDHHLSLGELPDACAVICCTRNDNEYPYLNLSGAGVAYKLAAALTESLGIDEIDHNLTALAALGTVTDIVPLDGENRILVKAGLKAIKDGANQGIDAILEVSGVNKNTVDSYSLGFVIGPRINAAGRLGQSEKGLELLMSDEYISSRELAEHLSKLNNERKKEQKMIYDLVIADIRENPLVSDCPVIISGGENYNKGVVGIVASKISEAYQKPTIILSYSDGTAEGSGRSRSGFSLIDALEYCNGLLAKYGGHQNAAGLALKTTEINAFRKKITEYAESIGYIPEQGNTTEICFDILEKDLNFNSVERLNGLEPYGNGNSQPVFSLKNVVLTEVRRIGSDGRHLSLGFKAGSSYLKAVCFNSSFYEPLLNPNLKYDLAFTLSINEFRERKNIQLMIKDIRFSEETGIPDDFMIVWISIHMIKYEKDEPKARTIGELAHILFENGMPKSSLMLKNNKDVYSITRDDIEYIFSKLKECDSGYKFKLNEKSDTLTLVKQYIAIEILTELGILKLASRGMYKYMVIEPYAKQRNRLEDSLVYCIFNRKEGWNGQQFQGTD